MRCLTCNYDLRNLDEHRCPECGRAFDPNDPAFKHPRRRYWLRVARYTIVGLVGLSIALFAVFFLLEWSTPPIPYKPDRGTLGSAIAVGATAVMAGAVLFFPFVAIGAMLITRWRR
jgi:hypothetical protein